jgi:predicted nucleic acid-binding Zn ribbon protein
MPETASAPSSTKDRPTKRYQCSICGKSFDSAETFDSHQKFEHSEPGHPKPLAGVG